MKSEHPVIIKVGLATCGIASGAGEVYSALQARLIKENINVELRQTACMGMCYNEPLVEVISAENERIVYGHLTTEKVDRLVDEHFIGGEPVSEWIVLSDKVKAEGEEFLAEQKRIVLRNCGNIDPENIQDYLAVNGYEALEKVLSGMTQQMVIEEVKRSGLRGRGGAGFSTGMKWDFTNQALGNQKYIVCNADEGDPGAFMDRSVLEGDPHSVLEGMLIAGYAIGSTEGYIYCRAEYPLAVKRLNIAIEQARERGFLGKNIHGSKFSFDIKIREGAGAFVCGEETALLMSIEGKRGMPRPRPPFPAQSGLWKKPTSINNVETFANIAWIILNGADAYNAYGTEKSKGTKVFALAGNIVRGGLVEVPMGITINDIVFKIGGGIPSGKKFKAVQMGGPSGGCIPASLGDTTVDYESITKTGAIVGSGGMIVMDEDTCMVDVAKFFLDFTQKESCGKCTFCRMGTQRMLEILERITNGEGKEEDIDLLEELARNVSRASLCALGGTAPNPVLTTLKYFRDEYIAHILDKKCPAKKCRALISYHIVDDKCKGCRVCIKYCPSGAIKGERKELHVIDQEKCVRCGLCMSVCKLDAIVVN